MSQISQIEENNIKDFFKMVIDQTTDIKNEINYALKSTKEINGRARMLSTTAKIEANRIGDIGRNFWTVSKSIDELSMKTDKALDQMKKQTIQEINALSRGIENKSISIQGSRLTNLALTNIRLVDRNLFERAADVRWWATDDILIKSLLKNNSLAFEEAENRLGIILKSYTAYYDLILCDTEGNCKCSGESKFNLSGINFSDKAWFKAAMNSTSGDEYGFDTVHHSPRINDDYTVIYSCKIHQDGNPESRVIGVLGAVFKWKEFAQRIVNETPLSPEEKTKTRVLICDGEGNILADTKERILAQKIKFNGKDELFQKEKGFAVVEKNETKKIVCHALSPGFEGYKSKNWHSLIIQDMEMNCHNKEVDRDDDESLDSIINLISSLSEKTQQTIAEINKINDETHVLSLNAAIEAARVGDEGRGFGVIAKFIGDLSKTTAEITTKMDSNTQKKIAVLNTFLSSNSRQIKGDRLSNLSFTNIDLIDRALYERTADVRWWATENSIINALNQKTNDSKDILSARLATILKYYTVYDDLIVCDMSGNIVANANSSNRLRENNMKNTSWFQNALKTQNGDAYGMDLIQEQKEDITTSLVFSCKVHRNDDVSRDVLGILGIVFKWEEFVKEIFRETPLNSVESNSSSLFILDSKGNKISENNKHGYIISQKEIKSLLEDKKNFQTITLGNSEVVLGHAESVGYEGFSTGWHALIVQPEIK